MRRVTIGVIIGGIALAFACSDIDGGGDFSVGSLEQALSTGSTTIPSTGQTFDIAITSPDDGATVPLGPFTVSGQVSFGTVAGAPANVVSIVDVSGSTSYETGYDCNGDSTVDIADDYNGDGTIGDILDCEIAGVIGLNEGLFGTVNVEVGMVPFGLYAENADAQPAAGVQIFTSPTDADLNDNGMADFEEIARSLDQGSIGSFTPYSVSAGTSFTAALDAMNDAFGSQPPGERNIAFFMSDGQGGGDLTSRLATAVGLGVVINTFAVGTLTQGCAETAPLKQIADATNGTCTVVSDPSDLSTSLPDLMPSGLDRVEVNGVEVVTDTLGNFNHQLSCASGETILIEAAGYAADEDSTEVWADITVQCCIDSDDDGLCDADDPCPNDPLNDADGDGVCGDVDNCPQDANADQVDTDGDGAGDVCDECPADPDDDIDGDGVCGDVDNCPDVPNPDQDDTDGDGAGDACDVCPADPDDDIDGDGVCGDVDNCPDVANADQTDTDTDGIGDVCDECPLDPENDADNDGICGDVDLCADTQIPESVPTKWLRVNNFALMDGDTVFDTELPASGVPAGSFTLEDTGGCSCEQIIVEIELGKGHEKFGCDIASMERWVALISEE